jgi:hypothetical protein
MCKKLMFLISLVMVLGLGTVASADDYDWTNDYPWSYLYISPWNWDPVTPSYGGPGLGDTAYIGGPEICVLDTDIAVERIRGPAWEAQDDAPGSSQTMLLIYDCNLFVDYRWEVEKTGDGNTALIDMYDSAKVFIDGRFVAHDEYNNQRVVINMRDNTEFRTYGDVRAGEWHDEYGPPINGDHFELNMTDNAYFYAGNDDDGFRLNEGNLLINVDSNAILEAEYIRFRGKDSSGAAPPGSATITINLSENGQLIVNDDNIELAGGDSNVTVNVTDNAVVDIDGDVRLGEDNDFSAQMTLNMSGQLINMGGDFVFIYDDDATGFTTVNLTCGLINTEGELKYETENWVVNICGCGVWVVDGDIVDDVYEQALQGHWVACPQLDCFDRISPRGNLIAEYDTPEYPGKTKIYVQDVNGQAWAPMPDDGATDLDPIVELCWCPGDSECPDPLDFHVFLSDDLQEVEDGNLHAWQGVQNGNCFTTEPLCLGKTYYWRIESVFDCCYYPGPIWQFTIVDSICIEDMEAYSDNANPIWETWLDGCGDANGVGGNGTGSCVYSDAQIVHDGDKSMRYYYDCSGQDMAGDERDCNYAIASRAFAGLDISSSCAEALELWFYGDEDNDATALEAMFLTVEDGSTNSATATYGDTAPEALADMQVEEWQQWDIALASLAGADLTDIVSLSLGFGDVTNCHREKGGWGVMWFDDICIFPCRCVPKYTPDIVDLNDDCQTNWLDIKIVADNWLESEFCNQ